MNDKLLPNTSIIGTLLHGGIGLTSCTHTSQIELCNLKDDICETIDIAMGNP